MNYLIDIDGTICEDIKNESHELFPTAHVIEDLFGINAAHYVNLLYDAGHNITFFTARKEEHREVTEKWLHENGFRWHSIMFDKPRGGNLIILDNLKGKYIQFLGAFPPIDTKID